MKYFLGADIGSSKTQILIADEGGQIIGQGLSGSGNYQVVGYEGMQAALKDGMDQALVEAEIKLSDISGAGFGISGYDWPSDKPRMLEVITRLGLHAPLEMYNDAILGLAAGSQDGWGIAVVSGSGCNCWGWDRGRKKIGRVTGFGDMTGEAAGSTELVYRAMQLIAHAWTKRGRDTEITQVLINYVGAKDVEDLLEGYTTHYYQVDGGAAPLIFQVAEAGDPVARQLIKWAGHELAELAKAVIRQLSFQHLEFEVVLVGSMFDGGKLLIDPMRESIQQLAPGARLVRLTVPPAVGALVIGMQAYGLEPTPKIRKKMSASIAG